MKTKVLAFAIGAAFSLSAVAGPAPSLPPGGIYVKVNGNEQIATGNASTFAGSNEISWGVFTVSTMETGAVKTPNDMLQGTNKFFYVGGQQGQVTGMFYGVQAGTPTPGNMLPGKGGYIDLYWRDMSTMSLTDNSVTAPAVRCGWNCATGYTEGTFLGRLYFDTGMDPNSATNTIVGTTMPSSNGFTGYADSYASVDTSAGGLWASQLDSNWFASWQGFRDLRFKNSYNYLPSWGTGVNGIYGAEINDPGQAMALPEPGALSLMGLAMAGMGLVLRRRQKRA